MFLVSVFFNIKLLFYVFQFQLELKLTEKLTESTSNKMKAGKTTYSQFLFYAKQFDITGLEFDNC